MGRSKKSSRDAPNYAYYDNPHSRFGMIYVDLLKSEQFQALPTAARYLYIACTAQAATEEGQKCLYTRLQQVNHQLNEGWSEWDIRTATVNQNQMMKGLFVFPQKHYQKYGYKRGSFSKYICILINAGFIRKRYGGGNQHAVNVYQFSDAWKTKPVPTKTKPVPT